MRLGTSFASALALVAVIISLLAAAPAAAGGAHSADPLRGQVYGLTADNRLISFSQDEPGKLRSDVALKGLRDGESVLGIDFRPATDRLYGLGSTGQLYVIDLATGVAAAVGAPLALRGGQFGVDFNPAADRLRIVSDAGQNLRVNPDTGVALTDRDLAYAAGDPNAGKAPTVAAAAYTNSDNDPATGTQLFDLDVALGALALQDPPNDGVLRTRVQAMASITGLAAFDLDSATRGLVAVQQSGQSASRLYRIDVATLSASPLGVLGAGETVRGLAITPR